MNNSVKMLSIFCLFSFSFFIVGSPFVSQSGQDNYLYNQFFRDKIGGVFVDIGAHDGVEYSNTYFFEKQLGWGGVCIEPIPSVFRELQKNRNCICVNGCIADFNGPAQFLLITGYSEMLSGLIKSYDPRHMARIDRELDRYGGTKKVIDVHCYVLPDLLKRYGITHVDYLSVDTEGSELEILRAIDFDVVFIDVISVENNYDSTEIRDFLVTKGYRFVTKLGGDEIYKRELP